MHLHTRTRRTQTLKHQQHHKQKHQQEDKSVRQTCSDYTWSQFHNHSKDRYFQPLNKIYHTCYEYFSD